MFYISQNQEDKIPKFRNAAVDFDIDALDVQFDKNSIKHDVLLPMITGLFKQTIIHTVERAVEKTLEPVMNGIGRQLSDNLLSSKFPTILENVRANLKSADTHKALYRRQDKLKKS